MLARLLVVELVRDDKMSAEQAAAWGRDKLHLAKLDASTVLDWFREAGDTVDRKARLEQVRKVFAGHMSLGDVYDDGWYQVKATDPLNHHPKNSWEWFQQLLVTYSLLKPVAVQAKLRPGANP